MDKQPGSSSAGWGERSEPAQDALMKMATENTENTDLVFAGRAARARTKKILSVLSVAINRSWRGSLRSLHPATPVIFHE